MRIESLSYWVCSKCEVPSRRSHGSLGCPGCLGQGIGARSGLAPAQPSARRLFMRRQDGGVQCGRNKLRPFRAAISVAQGFARAAGVGLPDERSEEPCEARSQDAERIPPPHAVSAFAGHGWRASWLHDLPMAAISSTHSNYLALGFQNRDNLSHSPVGKPGLSL